ncbi:DUF1735 domain-containing protein [Flavisolibacter sp. BT320]|nr:DUF1735 domain-containing protein [Flavisolibacter longurius]
MKISFKPRHTFLSFVCASLLAAGCNKPDDITLENEGTVYMPQASGTRGKLDMRLADTAQLFVFGAAAGGMDAVKSNVDVSFVIDAGQVAAYNQRNGTAYQLLPDDSYTISGLRTTIAAGQVSSEPLILGVFSKKIAHDKKYILPVTIASVSTGNINPDLKTTFFTIDTVVRKSVDVTTLGTLSVSHEYSGGADGNEGSKKVVDGDINSKYLYFDYVPNTDWMQLQYQQAVTVGAYTLTSANDASGRDPKTWRLAGSNDGTTWTVIDTRTDQSFESRFQTKRFEVPGTPQSYKYYRFYIDQNNGATLFQLAEWRLIQYE